MKQLCLYIFLVPKQHKLYPTGNILTELFQKPEAQCSLDINPDWMSHQVNSHTHTHTRAPLL